MIKVTLDTNVVGDSEVIEAARQAGCDLAAVTVTERETEGSSISVQVAALGQVAESGVYGEARYGQAVYTSRDSSHALEQILGIISNGSFPKSRESLSSGERRQLRDALILEAHVREGRTVFVSNDAKAFVNHDKRAKLEQAFSMRILTGREFIAACAAGSL